MEIAMQDLAKVPHFPLFYEELVARPREVARSILEYLGLPEHSAVTDFCSNIQDSSSSPYHAQHQIMWYRDDHRTRVGRWRENLTEEQQRMINEILCPLLRGLGYDQNSYHG